MVYLLIIASSFALSFLLTPLTRGVAFRLGLYDMPDRRLKTHTEPTPRIGGVAIFFSMMIVLVATRFLTHYPTGTIRNFRYILFGMAGIFTLGLADDTMPGGISYRWKFLFQIAAALLLVVASIRIHFFSPPYLAAILSVIWIVGVANALNLIDILDGLAATQAAIAAASFLAIGFPSEEIYVNILAATLLGATLGFLPHNFKAKGKVFMGDSGSLTLGYILAVLALGCSYSTKNPLAVYAPILILGVPIFETLFLIYIRVKQGMNPFRGSRDHIAHRLQMVGLSEKNIVLVMGSGTLVLSLAAFMLTRVDDDAKALGIYALLFLCLWVIARRLTRIQMKHGERH
ncbi:MAG: undecaprenyl/decaprenyl-phosphate alpha-N-acetylglucosaminyl 1-phosphate transferase [Elusimicrobia bacterium]|nr:undecaprenyl/decaprenyl-phosphate alpha-N-acetylglucosaminyl 1-phosphate transferase [Elusimicrobiota bacterium]